MFRAVLLPCALFLLLIATAPFAFAQADAAPRASSEWMKGYTLILVDAATRNDLIEARDFITAAGGTIAVVLPPHAIFGWITPAVEAKIVGQHHIRSVHRSAINAQSTAFRDAETRLAINLFNDMASGRSARHRARAAARQTATEATHPELIDALPHPHIDRDQMIRNLRLLGVAPPSDMRPQ